MTAGNASNADRVSGWRWITFCPSALTRNGLSTFQTFKLFAPVTIQQKRAPSAGMSRFHLSAKRGATS